MLYYFTKNLGVIADKHFNRSPESNSSSFTIRCKPKRIVNEKTKNSIFVENLYYCKRTACITKFEPMKKAYYLSTCDTCKRILKELDLPEDFTTQEIKTNPVSLEQLEEMKVMTGNYSELLNKRAQLYQKRNLKEKILSEEECKALILENYTFLKRPVFIIDDAIFVGNSKKTIAAAKEKLNSLR